MVIDEAHRLKNPTSRLFEHLCSIPHQHCLLLTGTPLQNKTEVGTNIPWPLLDLSPKLLSGIFSLFFISHWSFFIPFFLLAPAPPPPCLLCFHYFPSPSLPLPPFSLTFSIFCYYFLLSLSIPLFQAIHFTSTHLSLQYTYLFYHMMM